MNKVICSIFSIVAIAAYIKADPSQCYGCSVLEGTNCTTPSIPKIHVESCDDIDQENNSTDSTLCFTVSTKWLGALITERGCYYQEIEGEDFCSFFYRTQVQKVPYTNGFTCDLCYDDLCNDQPDVPSPTCVLVKYSGWEDLGDLGIWTNLDLAPVFVSRMRYCTVLCTMAVILHILGVLYTIVGHCNSDSKTVVGCGLLILAGLSLGTGLVIFVSSLSETLLEISQYHKESPSGPVYDYRYGWCFFTAGFAFIMTNMAALFSISGYLNRFSTVDEMVRQMVPGAERKLLEHLHVSNEYLVHPSSLQYDPFPNDRPKYEIESVSIMNKTPPDVCTTNKCPDYGVDSSEQASVIPNVAEPTLSVAQTLAGQTIPITIKSHTSTAPLSLSNLPMKYGTMHYDHSANNALQQGFLGVSDLGSSSSTSSSGYCGRSKTLQHNKNRKKCSKIETFNVPDTTFTDFGKRTNVDFSFSGSAV